MPLPRLSREFLGDTEGGDEDQIEPPPKKEEKILWFDSVIIAYFCPHLRKWKEKSRSLTTDVELSCIIIFLEPPLDQTNRTGSRQVSPHASVHTPKARVNKKL